MVPATSQVPVGNTSPRVFWYISILRRAGRTRAGEHCSLQVAGITSVELYVRAWTEQGYRVPGANKELLLVFELTFGVQQQSRPRTPVSGLTFRSYAEQGVVVAANAA